MALQFRDAQSPPTRPFAEVNSRDELAETLTAAVRAIQPADSSRSMSTSTQAASVASWMQTLGLPPRRITRTELVTAANMHHQALHRRKCSARLHRDEVVVLDMSAPRPRLSSERMRLALDLNAEERGLAKDVTDAAFSALHTELDDARLAGRLTTWESVLLAWDAADARADEAAKHLCALAYNDLTAASLEAVRVRAPEPSDASAHALVDVPSFRAAAIADPTQDAYTRLRRSVGLDVASCGDLRTMSVDPNDGFEISKAARYALNRHPDLCRDTLKLLVVPYVAEHLRDAENRAFWARSLVDDARNGTRDEFMEAKARDSAAERATSATIAVGVVAAGVAGDWWCETERVSAGQDSRRFSAVFNVSRSLCAAHLLDADKVPQTQLAPGTREARALERSCEEYLRMFAEDHTAAAALLMMPDVHRVDDEPRPQGSRKREPPTKTARSFSGDMAPKPTTW